MTETPTTHTKEYPQSNPPLFPRLSQLPPVVREGDGESIWQFRLTGKKNGVPFFVLQVHRDFTNIEVDEELGRLIADLGNVIDKRIGNKQPYETHSVAFVRYDQ